MKKPNKIYRSLGGKRNAAGAAFAVARHPFRALRSVFGYDTAARTAAESLNMDPTREGIQRVLAILKTWGKSYRAPKLSWVFSMLSAPRSSRVVDTRKLEL